LLAIEVLKGKAVIISVADDIDRLAETDTQHAVVGVNAAQEKAREDGNYDANRHDENFLFPFHK
jgi:hypothetical protein